MTFSEQDYHDFIRRVQKLYEDHDGDNWNYYPLGDITPIKPSYWPSGKVGPYWSAGYLSEKDHTRSFGCSHKELHTFMYNAKDSIVMGELIDRGVDPHVNNCEAFKYAILNYERQILKFLLDHPKTDLTWESFIMLYKKAVDRERNCASGRKQELTTLLRGYRHVKPELSGELLKLSVYDKIGNNIHKAKVLMDQDYPTTN